MTNTSLTAASLASLGWSDFFAEQIPNSADRPMRVAEVHRASVRCLSPEGSHDITLPSAISSGDIAVGDWVMIEPEVDRLTRILDRRSSLARRAAGPELRRQLVAANVDTLFIVSSCNDDFNEARIERFISMAFDAGSTPIILLTKADTTANPMAYVARAQGLAPDQQAIALNAHDPLDLLQLSPWCGAQQTVALLGSSGVGKTTITNALSGGNAATQDIRDDDAKGRHTTTSRSLHPIIDGGWLIDTPGMREFGLMDASVGIEAVFADIAELAEGCKFSDCAHDGEPGCAVRAAIDADELDPARVTRWQKLLREDALQAETIAQTRKRSRATTKYHKSAKQNRKRKGFDLD